MRSKIFLCDPQLLTSILETGHVIRRTKVIDGLPPDARIIGVRQDRDGLQIRVLSETFPDCSVSDDEPRGSITFRDITDDSAAALEAYVWSLIETDAFGGMDDVAARLQLRQELRAVLRWDQKDPPPEVRESIEEFAKKLRGG
jgi:hypothetical protein